MRLIKNVIVALLVIALVLPAVLASAEGIDYAQYSDQELTGIIKGAQQELSSRRITNGRRIEFEGYVFEEIAEYVTAEDRKEDPAPCLVIEGIFTNNNSEPVAPNFGTVIITAYQNGVECSKSGMYLPKGFNWDNGSKNVKDGGTISYFKAIPLENLEDDVEINIILLDMNTWDSSDPVTFVYSFGE